MDKATSTTSLGSRSSTPGTPRSPLSPGSFVREGMLGHTSMSLETSDHNHTFPFLKRFSFLSHLHRPAIFPLSIRGKSQRKVKWSPEKRGTTIFKFYHIAKVGPEVRTGSDQGHWILKEKKNIAMGRSSIGEFPFINLYIQPLSRNGLSILLVCFSP